MGMRNFTHRLNFLTMFPSAYKSLWYSLKMMATVEPLTPGTITASPIKNPKTPALAISPPFL